MNDTDGADQDEVLERLILGLRNNEPWAATDVVRRYGDSLHRIADSRLSPALKRRLDADDVMQSVFRTFFRRVRDSKLQVDDADQLWNLLCAITLTKVREQARFHRRKKRGIDQEATSAEIAEYEAQHQDVAGPLDPGILKVDFADAFINLLESLDEEENMILILKLGNHSNANIAEHVGVSERTVRRILAKLQKRLEEELS